MKLLVSWMRELSRYVSREFYYIMQDLIRLHEWRQIDPPTLSHHSGALKKFLLETLGEVPQVILFWEVYDLVDVLAPALRELGCRVVLFADDVHMLWGQESKRDVRLQALSQCDVVISSYAYVFHNFYPELAGQKTVMWTPHSASPDFVLPFNDQPENAILLSG